MPVEHRPDAGAFADRGLAAATGHCHREQTAADDRFFDLADDLEMVGRPRQMERERKVGVAEVAEVRSGAFFTFGVPNVGQLADVAPGDG
jgi:hypothetical protein